MPGNDSNTVPYKRALELNRYSRNDETMPPSFELCLHEFGTPEGVKFIGEILRTNKLIEFLTVELRDMVFPADCFEGVLHFISNNPSLKVLRFQTFEDGPTDPLQVETAGLGLLLLQAASKNQHIEKIIIGDAIVKSLPSNLEELELPSTLKELDLWGFSESVGNAWPEIHSLRTLRLHDGCYRYHHGDYKTNLSALLGKLKDSTSSRHIKYLQLEGWSPIIPTYLFSPNCCLVTLHLERLSFAHGGHELYSVMDGLLWGLAGSKGTTSLILENCMFDSLANQKLLQGLQSSLLGIRRLDFITNDSRGDLDGEYIEHLFGCDQLDSLGFECGVNDWDVSHIDGNVDNINRGIERCSLTSLKLSTDCLANFGAALSTAYTNNALTSLKLTNCDFSSGDVSCLVSLIEDERSQLRTLTITEFFSSAELITSIFKALQRKTKLETLCLETLKDKEVLLGLSESLGQLKNLTTLEIALGKSLSPDDEKNIATAMSNNWILESMQIVGNDSPLLEYSRQAEPNISHALNMKLDKFTCRNKFKKAIFESPVALSQEEIKCWLKKLGSVWELPDGFTLAFQLLQYRAGCFF